MEAGATCDPHTVSRRSLMASPVSRAVADSTPLLQFDDFYRAHRDQIVRAIALTIGDVHLAADATSEAMIKAHQRWTAVSGYANPAGWTYRVALNQARGWRRTALRRRTTPGDVPEVGSVDAMPTEGAVVDALAQLSLGARSVVVCRLFLDWSVERTAEALDLAPGTVKSRLARSLEQLRPLLGDEAE